MKEIRLTGIGTLEELELMRTIERIKHGGTTTGTTEEGQTIELRIEKIPEEAIIWE
ncbi:MAG: hypothetical protein N3G19_01420 [Candidatus Pacearchaeota archaeon]|nr:hypothetical protein [Candidatus Pacearchaeota archaeon]